MSKIKERMVLDRHLGGYIQGGDPGTWCPKLWQWAIETFEVRSVLDVGCGEGHSSRFFQQQGCRILGVEGCARALAETVIPGHVAAHDFTKGPFVPDRPIDLVWSCEFLEHVESLYEPNILAAFAQARKAILVTHAFPHQTSGHHHVNCRPTSYWIRRIEPLGFRCDVKLTREARTVTLGDFTGVNHFARSGLVFVRTDEARASGAWSAVLRGMRINWGFRLSTAYRRQVRRHRLLKRQQRGAT